MQIRESTNVKTINDESVVNCDEIYGNEIEIDYVGNRTYVKPKNGNRTVHVFNLSGVAYCSYEDKTKKAVPILIKYIEQFDSEDRQIQYIGALGVKGFDDATEYLIEKYKKYLHPYNQWCLNDVSQTLARICDLRYLDTYFEFLSNDVTIDACYLVQMLGKLKVEKAIPYLIKLVDCVAIIPERWIGFGIEDQKFYVSQCAIEALGRFKRKELNQYIEKFLNPSAIEWIKYTEPNENANILKSTYKDYIKLATKAMC